MYWEIGCTRSRIWESQIDGDILKCIYLGLGFFCSQPQTVTSESERSCYAE